MKKIIFLVLTSIFFCLSLVAKGQVVVSASIDSSSIAIGQQTLIHFKVQQPIDKLVQLPVISDRLIEKIYVIDVEGDTVANGADITIANDIRITVFEPGAYTIPSFVCKSDNVEYKTDSLTLEVRDVSMQFEEGNIPGDIKPIYAPPYSALLRAMLIIAAVVFLLIVIAGVFYYKKHKSDPEPYERNNAVANSSQPELTALELIRALGEKKLWQIEGKEKLFFTELTDILRQYFYRRYKIQALEMTSTELLDALKKQDISIQLRNDVREVCFTSDMTKFAKHKPTDDECARCVELSENIVLKTMKVENPTALVNKEETTKK